MSLLDWFSTITIIKTSNAQYCNQLGHLYQDREKLQLTKQVY